MYQGAFIGTFHGTGTRVEFYIFQGREPVESVPAFNGDGDYSESALELGTRFGIDLDEAMQTFGSLCESVEQYQKGYDTNKFMDEFEASDREFPKELFEPKKEDL